MESEFYRTYLKIAYPHGGNGHSAQQSLQRRMLTSMNPIKA